MKVGGFLCGSCWAATETIASIEAGVASPYAVGVWLEEAALRVVRSACNSTAGRTRSKSSWVEREREGGRLLGVRRLRGVERDGKVAWIACHQHPTMVDHE